MKASFAVMLAGLLFGPAAAIAASSTPDADALLQRAIDNYRAKTSRTTVAMTIHRPDWERSMQMRSWTRGEDDALVRFLAPAKDAGNATLKLHTAMWVFNPKLNQVIKLPTSMMAQSWMGSDFSYNDLSRSNDIMTDYTHRISASATVEGHTVWSMECTPKPGAPVVWGKVQIKLRDDSIMLEETYFDQDMKPARRMTTDRIGMLGGRLYPLSMTIRPLDMPGSWTRAETSDGEFNIALQDYLFTLSSLQNPRQ